jgi:hypothetical protein
MALDLMREKGVPIEEQLMSFTWRDMVRTPSANSMMTRLLKSESS